MPSEGHALSLRLPLEGILAAVVERHIHGHHREETITLQLEGIEHFPHPPNFLGYVDRAFQ